MRYNPRSYKMASDDECAYISSDDEDQHELEIKPPQAKIFKRSHSRRTDKHSHSAGSRHVYVSGSRHHHKSHHSHHHQDDRYPKENFDATRSHVKEYEERARKKAYHHNRPEERYKEQDLREKLDRRKRHGVKDYDRKEEDSRKERNRKERHRHEVKEHRNHDERRRHHRDEHKHAHTSEDKHAQSVSDDSMSPSHEKNMVIDIETSPPVLRGDEYSDREPEEVEEEEEGEERREQLEEEEVEEDSDNTESSSSSSSNDSNNSSSGSSEESGSSDSSSSEGEVVETQENKDDEETNHVSENAAKEESSPNMITNDNDGIDSEIELEKDTLPSYYPAIQGCRSVEEFQCLNRIEEGTYGVVYRAREKRTDRIVALKRLKMEKEKNGFPITSLREINTLLKAQHPNIVTVKEIVVGSNMDKIFIVMDYVEHDLKSLMETMKQKKKCFTSSEVKCLMLQLLRAVNHLHNNWILHRDLKTSNLLFSHAGILKVGDFGLAREYGSPLKQYTPIVVTLWYRAPELLLGTKEYSTSVDVWSVGCIFAELLCMEPLFPGKTEPDQLKRIFKALGTPNEKTWPEYPKLPIVLKTNLPDCPPHGIRAKFVPNILSDVGYNLLTSLLCYNPKKRITAEVALLHDYFSEHPLPIEPAMFSTWPAKSEHGRKATVSSPKPPSGGQNYKELREDDGFYIGVGERGNHPAGFNAESTFSLKF